MGNSDKERKPDYKRSSFYCPHCGVYAYHYWRRPGWVNSSTNEFDELSKGSSYNLDLDISHCNSCSHSTVWVNSEIVYPLSSLAPLPVEGMPDEVRQIYDEARLAVAASPRAAAALLRLAIQVLMPILDLPGKNLNEDIGELVKSGVPRRVQKALDGVRVVGNNAVHPGQIEMSDNQNIALALFDLVNLVVTATVVQDQVLDNIYNHLPEGVLEQIENRDNGESE